MPLSARNPSLTSSTQTCNRCLPHAMAGPAQALHTRCAAEGQVLCWVPPEALGLGVAQHAVAVAGLVDNLQFKARGRGSVSCEQSKCGRSYIPLMCCLVGCFKQLSSRGPASTTPHLDARVLHTLARRYRFGALCRGAWHRLHALHGARAMCPERSS